MLLVILKHAEWCSSQQFLIEIFFESVVECVHVYKNKIAVTVTNCIFSRIKSYW